MQEKFATFFEVKDTVVAFGVVGQVVEQVFLFEPGRCNEFGRFKCKINSSVAACRMSIEAGWDGDVVLCTPVLDTLAIGYWHCDDGLYGWKCQCLSRLKAVRGSFCGRISSPPTLSRYQIVPVLQAGNPVVISLGSSGGLKPALRLSLFRQVFLQGGAHGTVAGEHVAQVTLHFFAEADVVEVDAEDVRITQ